MDAGMGREQEWKLQSRKNKQLNHPHFKHPEMNPDSPKTIDRSASTLPQVKSYASTPAHEASLHPVICAAAHPVYCYQKKYSP